jgi:hypothetical protein
MGHVGYGDMGPCEKSIMWDMGTADCVKTQDFRKIVPSSTSFRMTKCSVLNDSTVCHPERSEESQTPKDDFYGVVTQSDRFLVPKPKWDKKPVPASHIFRVVL